MADEDRDELSKYPCTYYGAPNDTTVPCAPERALDKTFCASCPLQPVYRAHIALRADMRKLRAAVLGDMTAEEAGILYERAAESMLYTQDTSEDGDKVWKMAQAVKAL